MQGGERGEQACRYGRGPQAQLFCYTALKERIAHTCTRVCMPGVALHIASAHTNTHARKRTHINPRLCNKNSTTRASRCARPRSRRLSASFLHTRTRTRAHSLTVSHAQTFTTYCRLNIPLTTSHPRARKTPRTPIPGCATRAVRCAHGAVPGREVDGGAGAGGHRRDRVPDYCHGGDEDKGARGLLNTRCSLACANVAEIRICPCVWMKRSFLSRGEREKVGSRGRERTFYIGFQFPA